MSNARGHAKNTEGFVLIAVLSVMTLLSGIAAIMLISSRNAVDTAAVSSGSLEADALIQSGISVVAYQLFVLKMPAERVNAQQIRLDRGLVTLTIATDAGKVDLNASSQTLLAAAYQASGLKTLTPQSFAARIVDWRDADNDVSDEGAETAEYKSIGLPYGPGNRSFRSLGDLRWVPGVSAADMKVLAGFVTIYNPRGRLDVFSAPGAIVSVLPRVDADTLSEVVATRKIRNQASIARLEDLLLVQSSLIDAELPNTYLVSLQVEPARAGAARHVEFVMTAGVAPGSAYQILHWAE